MSLSTFFHDYPDVRYIMYGGKGGLGKTTFSAATGYYLAERGFKVLVFSVDPQASLSDIFRRDIFGQGEVEIMPNLYACEIDADRRIAEYQGEIRQKILDMYGFDQVPQEIDDYIRASSAEPAMEESAIFDQVVDIVTTGGYDYYIYDMVPLGHALYYLSMASVYDAWIDQITRLREQMREYDSVAATMRREKELEEDEILKELLYIKRRINTASGVLTDAQKTAFFFVVIPEQMAILDTQHAAELFARFQVPIRGYIVNRVVSEALLNEAIPEFLRNRIEMQRGHLQEIDEQFKGKVLARVAEFDTDIHGLPAIEKMAQEMFGDSR